MSQIARVLKSCWNAIVACPGWLKFLTALIVLTLFSFDLVPRALRWPIRILIPPFGIWGFLQIFFVLRKRTPLQITGEFLRHPFMWCIALVVISSLIKENYPFSHYPMYSKPRPYKEYFFLGTVGQSGETIPVPMPHTTTQTSAKTGRIYRGRRDELLRSEGLQLRDLTDAHRAKIGAEVLDLLHQLSEKRHGEGSVNEVWRLVEVILVVGSDGLNETHRIVAERDYTR